MIHSIHKKSYRTVDPVGWVVGKRYRIFSGNELPAQDNYSCDVTYFFDDVLKRHLRRPTYQVISTTDDPGAAE